MWTRRDTVVEDEVASGGSPMWSPAQIVAVVLGIAATAFGAVALARTGIHPNALPDPRTTVLGFPHTQVLAYAEIAFGLLMIIAGMAPVAGTSLMSFLGAVALALGVVVVAKVWPARMAHWLGVAPNDGWLFVAVGGVALLAALMLPVFGGSTYAHRRRRVVGPNTY